MHTVRDRVGVNVRWGEPNAVAPTLVRGALAPVPARRPRWFGSSCGVSHHRVVRRGMAVRIGDMVTPANPGSLIVLDRQATIAAIPFGQPPRLLASAINFLLDQLVGLDDVKPRPVSA